MFEATYLNAEDGFLSFQWGTSEKKHRFRSSDIVGIAAIDRSDAIRTDLAIKFASYSQIRTGDRVHIKTTGGARFEADVLDAGESTR